MTVDVFSSRRLPLSLSSLVTLLTIRRLSYHLFFFRHWLYHYHHILSTAPYLTPAQLPTFSTSFFILRRAYYTISLKMRASALNIINALAVFGLLSLASGRAVRSVTADLLCLNDDCLRKFIYLSGEDRSFANMKYSSRSSIIF